MSFADRLMRQVGPYVTADAGIVAIDMATSADVDPPGPVGVVVTDAEILLVASGSDGGRLTKIPATDIAGAARVDADVLALAIASDERLERTIVLDFRYFGVTDDTITKLLARFPRYAVPS
jgi:hypothetical protein